MKENKLHSHDNLKGNKTISSSKVFLLFCAKQTTHSYWLIVGKMDKVKIRKKQWRERGMIREEEESFNVSFW